MSSLRSECVYDACLAHGMCKIVDADASDCATWCCEGYNMLSIFISFLVAGIVFLAMSLLLRRFHTVKGAVPLDNVESGVSMLPMYSNRMFESSGLPSEGYLRSGLRVG
ncbi:hypothetical protein TRVL_10024 [Trypanosoma vivax]|nr:hypothetical protein TRVL_10024 [Trypanosoma vivax]